MRRFKRMISIVIIIVLAITLGIVVIGNMGKKQTYVEQVSEQKVKEAFALLNNSLSFETVRYQEYIGSQTIDYELQDAVGEVEGGEKNQDYDKQVKSLDYQQTAEYTVTVAKAGLYSLGLDYCTGGSNLSDYRIAVTINDEKYFEEMSMITLPLMWKDATKDFPLDRYGDETAPEQIRDDSWHYTDLYNTAYYTAEPLYFYLEAGKNNITIENMSADGLTLGQLYVNTPTNDIPTYTE